MNDFVGESRARLDAEWLALNAVRETLGISTRGLRGSDSTYQRALAVGRELAPTLFDPEFGVLAAGQEPSLVREYRQRAGAQSKLQRRDISPLELIQTSIEELEALSRASGSGERDQLQRAINERLRARDYLDERRFSEHQLLQRDVFQASRPELPVPPQALPGAVEYLLPLSRVLRLRLLHPDRPEHTTGADLIYEFCEGKQRVVRLAFVQYKIWDGRSLLFSEAGGLPEQLDRLDRICCRTGLCHIEAECSPPAGYRLPYCASFLRPTDRLQSPDSTMLSSGTHVPVCVARTLPLGEAGGRILRHDRMRDRSVSQRSFEELFNRGLLGSRWLSYEAVEEPYREHGLFSVNDRIVVYAQEYDIHGL